MGNKCCNDRNKTSAKAPDAILKDQRKSNVNAYDTKKRALSVGYNSKGDDAEKFDKAFENNDLKAFVDLLKSNQSIESFEERMHPWAADPKTVGALAGTQLAILASAAAEDNDHDMKQQIGEAGAVAPLVDFLRSKEEDRVQTAVVALGFLTEDCSLNRVAAYKAGAMELLMAHLDSPIIGMRAATASLLRNLCVEKDEYRRRFVELGGIPGLVRQLNSSPDPSNTAEVQLEAILNLHDLVEKDNGEVILQTALEAIKAGAESALKKLTKAQDEEVQSAAKELLEVLEGVER